MVDPWVAAGCAGFEARYGDRDASQATPLWWLGYAQFQEKEYADCDETFGRVLALYPAYTNSWWYRAEARFHQSDLDGFLAEYGTLTDAEQVNRLNEKIRPYLLRRQKGDVEKTLVPLDETIVWVEMTVFQKRCYRAVLEGNREILVRGAEGGAAMPSLVNLQMELRKCCNHPYLIKGVEDAETGGMGRAEYTDALLKASGKFVLLDKLLPKLKAEGHRVLIFSQMVKMLDILEDYLVAKGYGYERLDGSTANSERQHRIDRFNTDLQRRGADHKCGGEADFRPIEKAQVHVRLCQKPNGDHIRR